MSSTKEEGTWGWEKIREERSLGGTIAGCLRQQDRWKRCSLSPKSLKSVSSHFIASLSTGQKQQWAGEEREVGFALARGSQELSD